jgi:peptide deformylase
MILTDDLLPLVPSDDVASEEEAAELISELVAELAASPASGVGLAAPQIGKNKRAFIIRGHKSLDFINSHIIELRDPIIFKQEGCLSYPNQSVKTVRYARVVISDMYRPQGITLTGLDAVIAQHEHQHTIGQNMYANALSKLTDETPCLCNSGKTWGTCCKSPLIKNMRVM